MNQNQGIAQDQGFIVEAGLPNAGKRSHSTLAKVEEAADPGSGAAAKLIARAEAFAKVASNQLGTTLPDGRKVERITFTGLAGKPVQFEGREECKGFMALMKSVTDLRRAHYVLEFYQIPGTDGQFAAVARMKQRNTRDRGNRSHGYVKQFA